jgi:quinol monooxygenase YgiN
MIVRIVKMVFEPSQTDAFLKVFDASKEQIRNFDGCLFLELLRGKNTDNIFFTHSHWLSEQHLENYRNSELFKTTWAATKVLFKEKPEAWSLESKYKKA